MPRKKPNNKEPAFREVDFTKKNNGGDFDDLKVSVREFTLELNQFNKLKSHEKDVDTGEEETHMKFN